MNSGGQGFLSLNILLLASLPEALVFPLRPAGWGPEPQFSVDKDTEAGRQGAGDQAGEGRPCLGVRVSAGADGGGDSGGTRRQ